VHQFCTSILPQTESRASPRNRPQSSELGAIVPITPDRDADERGHHDHSGDAIRALASFKEVAIGTRAAGKAAGYYLTLSSTGDGAAMRCGTRRQ